MEKGGKVEGELAGIAASVAQIKCRELKGGREVEEGKKR